MHTHLDRESIHFTRFIRHVQFFGERLLSGKVMDSAGEMGADMIITACPLCLYNLSKNAPGHQLPVYYFTELLAEALGVKD